MSNDNKNILMARLENALDHFYTRKTAQKLHGVLYSAGVSTGSDNKYSFLGIIEAAHKLATEEMRKPRPKNDYVRMSANFDTLLEWSDEEIHTDNAYGASRFFTNLKKILDDASRFLNYDPNGMFSANPMYKVDDPEQQREIALGLALKDMSSRCNAVVNAASKYKKAHEATLPSCQTSWIK